MNYLLDASSFLWFVNNDNRLSAGAAECIVDAANEIYLSLASIWEIAIKAKLGRGLELRRPFPEFIDHHLNTNQFRILGIRVSHLKRVHDLPLYHRDPFDRLLIAQSQVENIPVITSDAAFDLYSVERVW